MIVNTPEEREALRQLIKREIGDINLTFFHRVTEENKKEGNDFGEILIDFEPFMERFFTASFSECFKMHEIMPDNKWAQFQHEARSHIKLNYEDLSQAEIEELRSKIHAFQKGTDIT